MARFIASEPFWNLFPQAEIGIVVARGLENHADRVKDAAAIAADLEGALNESRKFLTGETLSQCPVVAVWRDAFKLFKTKKGARSSIEALLKRVEKGKGLGSVNPLVDIYNAVSLAWGFPVGGEDLDAFRGDLRLDVSAGGDPFLALGDEAEEPTLPGEVCYRDDAGAVCRCWNWRDGQRTMLTEDTVNAFLVIESVAPERREDLRRALETLAEKARRRLGGTCRVVVADRENRSVSLE